MQDDRQSERIAPAAAGVEGLATSSRAFGPAMFAILLVSYAINAMDRQLFPLLASDVRREYGFSLAKSGFLSTVFTLGMALAGVPTGYLLARFTRKVAVEIGIAIFSAGTALTAFAHGFTDMVFYRTATGVGEAMQLTALLTAATSYFAGTRGAAAGSVNFTFGIGAMIGPVLAAMLLSTWKTWRAPMIVFGVLGFLALAVIVLTVRPWLTELAGQPGNRAKGAGALTLLNRNSLILTAMSLIGGMIIYGYLGMYPTYLREHLAYSPGAAGRVMSTYGIGALASIGGGWLGDRFSPRLVMGGAFLTAAVLGCLLFDGFPVFAVQATLSFAWGLVVSGILYVNLAGYHVKAVTHGLAGSASGVFVSSLYGSAAISGYSIGWLADHASWVSAGLIQISLLSAVGAFLAAFLQPDSTANSWVGVPEVANEMATARRPACDG
jgi:DHA1 family inner membrane transport protein